MTGSPDRGRAPDFLIVGHPKCGTTALYRTLRGHPQIFMPEIKETWYFVPELHSRFRHRAWGRPDTWEEYLALFADASAAQRAGECSPSYLVSEHAAGRIAAALPEVRIVALLREPASFLRSLHMQFVQTHVEDETDLGKALALEPRRRAGERLPRHSPRPQMLRYSEHVLYAEQLRRYHAVLPREQVHVIVYEDYRRDNERVVRELLRFLGVDARLPLQLAEANPSVRVRNRSLHTTLQAVTIGRGPFARAAKGSLKLVSSRRARRIALRQIRRRAVFAEPDPVDERLMLELRHRFRGEVEAVSEYLGRDLVGEWGYDRLG
ncbi:MAG TPA: sulfotransferase [Solirubrobacteraceae bacterium]|jgi:hypothetical protein|nr:sulfotransferase [Solirubrobacteraceae bacterium]